MFGIRSCVSLKIICASNAKFGGIIQNLIERHVRWDFVRSNSTTKHHHKDRAFNTIDLPIDKKKLSGKKAVEKNEISESFDLYGKAKDYMKSGSQADVDRTMSILHKTYNSSWNPTPKALKLIEIGLIRTLLNADLSTPAKQLELVNIINVMILSHRPDTMPNDLLDAINIFLLKCDRMDIGNFRQVMISLHGIKFYWHHFKPEVQVKLQEIFTSSDFYENVGIDIAVGWLSRMTEMEFPRECVNFEKLQNAVKKLDFRGDKVKLFPTIFLNLSKMDFCWTELTPHMQGLIHKYAQSLLDSQV
jgi:hypothetical protein